MPDLPKAAPIPLAGLLVGLVYERYSAGAPRHSDQVDGRGLSPADHAAGTRQQDPHPYAKARTSLLNVKDTYFIPGASLRSEPHEDHHLPTELDRRHRNRLAVVRSDAPPPVCPRRGVANDR